MKNNRGITLIALVITIVVLLILAGISLVAIVGENGIINRAKFAIFAQEMQEIQENVELKKQSIVMDEHIYGTENVKIFESNMGERSDLTYPDTLKQEIIYVRKGLPSDETPSDQDPDTLNENTTKIYIVDKETGKNREDTYIYDEQSNTVFKIQPTIIGGKVYHSYQVAQLRKGNTSSDSKPQQDLIIKDESSIVEVNGEKYYEPDLKGFSSSNTEIVYYSEDFQEQILVTAKDYISSGKKNVIQRDDKNYTFHEYTSNQRWANVKTTGTGLEGWWVWIPRYAYKIDASGTSATEPIHIIYVDIEGKPLKAEYNGTLPEGYEVHPAFTVDGKPLKGIWMSKYEPSKTDQSPSLETLAPDMSGFDKNYTYIELYDVVTDSFTEELQLSTVDLNTVNSENKWYNYSQKQWANVKTIANGLESWWVWIPRYAYSKNADSNSGKMDVIFVDLKNTPLDKVKFPNGLPEGYEVHPAFTTSDGELKGIWMSKYEPSYGEPKGMEQVLEPDLNGFDKNYTYLEIYNSETQSFSDEVLLKDANISELNTDTTKWYNYSEKVWANVKTVANGLESWWVWIPRYAYKIGADSTYKSTSVIFIDKNNNPLNTTMYPNGLPSNYIVHPAFTTSDGELSGIWMSKYEPSYGEPVGMKQVLEPNLYGFDEENTYIEIYNPETEEFSDEILLKDADTSELNTDTTKWYDYSEKIWANIKTVANGLESWWVWIPRYAYQIGADSTYKSTSIIFIDKNNKPLNTEMYPNGLPNNYTVHPAFTTSDGELSGIWMSKYEPSKVD